MQSEDDYSVEEFYEEFIKDSESEGLVPEGNLITQRIGDKELIKLVSKASRRTKADVEDVLNGFWKVLNHQLEHGREFNFGGIFTARLYKPFPRRLYDNNIQGFKISSARPRLKLVPTEAYSNYLYRGLHCPVCYFPAEKTRGQDKSKLEFTLQWKQAYGLWYTEDQRRKQKAFGQTKNNHTEQSSTLINA